MKLTATFVFTLQMLCAAGLVHAELQRPGGRPPRPGTTRSLPAPAPVQGDSVPPAPPAKRNVSRNDQPTGISVVDEFVAKAAAAGIQQSDITRAILEGRFVPPYDDLRGVYLGMDQIQVGAPYLVWGRMFGAFGDLDSIRTFQNGKWVQRTGRDLAYQMFMGFDNQKDLSKSTGLNPDVQQTYQQALDHLGEKRDLLVKPLEKYMAAGGADCLLDFFSGQTGSFRKRGPDYEAMYAARHPAEAAALAKDRAENERLPAPLTRKEMMRGIAKTVQLVVEVEGSAGIGTNTLEDIISERLQASGVLIVKPDAGDRKRVPRVLMYATFTPYNFGQGPQFLYEYHLRYDDIGTIGGRDGYVTVWDMVHSGTAGAFVIRNTPNESVKPLVGYLIDAGK